MESTEKDPKEFVAHFDREVEILNKRYPEENTLTMKVVNDLQAEIRALIEKVEDTYQTDVDKMEIYLTVRSMFDFIANKIPFSPITHQEDEWKASENYPEWEKNIRCGTLMKNKSKNLLVRLDAVMHSTPDSPHIYHSGEIETVQGTLTSIIECEYDSPIPDRVFVELRVNEDGKYVIKPESYEMLKSVFPDYELT